jgi:hypothetical protein
LNPSKFACVFFAKDVPGAIKNDNKPENFSDCTSNVALGADLLGSNLKLCSPVNKPGMPHSLPRHLNSSGELTYIISVFVSTKCGRGPEEIEMGEGGE